MCKFKLGLIRVGAGTFMKSSKGHSIFILSKNFQVGHANPLTEGQSVTLVAHLRVIFQIHSKAQHPQLFILRHLSEIVGTLVSHQIPSLPESLHHPLIQRTFLRGSQILSELLRCGHADDDAVAEVPLQTSKTRWNNAVVRYVLIYVCQWHLELGVVVHPAHGGRQQSGRRWAVCPLQGLLDHF